MAAEHYNGNGNSGGRGCGGFERQNGTDTATANACERQRHRSERRLSGILRFAQDDTAQNAGPAKRPDREWREAFSKTLCRCCWSIRAVLPFKIRVHPRSTLLQL
jgi:hypothetical protein